MFVVNHAKTGIQEVDIAISTYLGYLASNAVLPEGNYALAGGSFRCIFDKTRLRDLDIYVLGSFKEHNDALNKFAEGYCSITTFCNPFAQFRVSTMAKNVVKERQGNIFNKQIEPPDPSDWDSICAGNSLNVDVQLISYAFDSDFGTKIPVNILKDAKYVDRSASCLNEILNSFDVTISKAGVEFIVKERNIAVTEIQLPPDFLIDIALKKLRLNSMDTGFPQQLCSLKRFHKLIKLGYEPDENFFSEWDNRVRSNPHLMEFQYD